MANALIKNAPTVAVTPAVPTVLEQVESYVDVSGVAAVSALFSQYAVHSSDTVNPWNEVDLYYANGPHAGNFANIRVRMLYTPSGESYRFHYLAVPAQTGSAEQTLVDRNEGWIISANSIVNIDGGKAYKATFKIPDGVVGVYCGTRARSDVEGGSQIWDWLAFRKDKTVLSIINWGNLLATGIAHNSASVLGIMFDSKKTLFTVDGVLVASSGSKTSLPVEMVASLYAPVDEVYDPTLTAFTGGVGDCTFAPMVVLGGLATVPTGYATFLPMEVTVVSALNNISFLPMNVKGGLRTADAYASFQSMRVTAHAALAAPAFTSAVCSFSPLRVTAITSGHMNGTPTFLPMKVKGGIPTSDGSYSFEALQVYSAGYTDSRTEAFANEWTTYTGAGTPVAIKPAIVSESMRLAVVFTPITVKVTNAASVMTFTGTHALLSTLHGLAITVLDFGTPTPPYTESGDVWVVNDDTNATSTYANFAFNSYAKLGERYYGVKADGLYLLEGDDDEGDATLASINFGQQDFGTTAAKRVVNVYIGVSSTGVLLLKVSTNSTEAVYKQQRVSEDQRAARFVPGKGMQGTLLAFELYNDDNADFTLSSVEFHAVPLTRRI